MRDDAARIGTVFEAVGGTVRIRLDERTATGLTFVDGEPYRIGQVGSFLKVPLGPTTLFGIVSLVGASESLDEREKGVAPITNGVFPDKDFGNRWIKAQLFGEGSRRGSFQRGISQYPTFGDPVFLVTAQDLATIYGSLDESDAIQIGHLANTDAIGARIDVNKLVSRHVAVVGATGSGKSTTVAAILHALTDSARFPSSRVLVIDLHSEYATAFQGKSRVYRASDYAPGQSAQLCVPYWALTFDELNAIAFENLTETAAALVAERIAAMKRSAAKHLGEDPTGDAPITADTPLPFSIRQLWYELHHQEFLTVVPTPGGASDEVDPAYVLDGGQPQKGDASTLTPPQFRNIKTTGAAAERVQYAKGGLNIRRNVVALHAKLRDPRLSFLFDPGPWSPGIDGQIKQDLDAWLQSWIGGTDPITILDLSGVPASIVANLLGSLLRIIYDAIFWARKLPEGGVERPLLVVMEEAHTYLGADSLSHAARMARRIVKEGRKYGIGAMIVSQRPSEIDPTILSQCGTIIAMRLANGTDRAQVVSSSSDELEGLFTMLPVLRTGEAIVVGEATALPMRTIVEAPSPSKRPDSRDPKVSVPQPAPGEFVGMGGWNQPIPPERYDDVVVNWRTQSVRSQLKEARPDDGLLLEVPDPKPAQDLPPGKKLLQRESRKRKGR